MGIFSEAANEYGFLNEEKLQSYVEMFLEDDISRMSTVQIAEFCAPGGVGEALVEAKVLGKKTLVRLSKTDDLDRRTMMIAMRMAKDSNDLTFDKLALNRVKERELLDKIRTKYGAKAEKEAKLAQKEYIKTMRKVPASFMKFGGAERV